MILIDQRFVQCHRSFIVNMDAVSELQNFCRNPVINALIASYAERCTERNRETFTAYVLIGL